MTPETIKNLNLKSAVLEELIRQHLLLREARRLGLEVTDEELMDGIGRVPDFQANGRFDKSRYVQALRNNRMTPADFEKEWREQLTVKKLYDLIQDHVQVTEAEVRERYRLEQEKINLYFVRLSAGDFVAQSKIPEEQIKTSYERNKNALKEPLKVQVEYIGYPFEDFSSRVQPTEKEIEDFYNANRAARFQQPRAARVRHILFRVPRVPAGGDLKEKDPVRLKAEAVLTEARAGKDFARLARDFSEDPSAAKGGEVGWFAPGQLLPALDKAVFALKKGETTDVLETPLGYHILKVEEIKGEKTRSLKEAREEIARGLKAERGKGEAQKAADADRDKALAGADLSSVAKERGVPFKVSPYFSRDETVPEVGAVEEFSKTAFSIVGKEVAAPVEGPNGYYVMRVRQRREPSVPSLDQARPQIEKRLKETKALELATQKGEALLGRLKKERDIRRLAKEEGLVVEETGLFPRDAPEIPRVGVLREIRSGGILVSSRQPVAERIYTQDGRVYLFSFKESRGADMERFDREKRELQEKALQEKKQKALKQFVDSLKAKARITPNAQALEEG